MYVCMYIYIPDSPASREQCSSVLLQRLEATRDVDKQLEPSTGRGALRDGSAYV